MTCRVNIQLAGLVIGGKRAFFDFGKGEAAGAIVRKNGVFGIKNKLGIGRSSGNHAIALKIDRLSVAQLGVWFGKGKDRPRFDGNGDLDG